MQIFSADWSWWIFCDSVRWDSAEAWRTFSNSISKVWIFETKPPTKQNQNHGLTGSSFWRLTRVGSLTWRFFSETSRRVSTCAFKASCFAPERTSNTFVSHSAFISTALFTARLWQKWRKICQFFSFQPGLQGFINFWVTLQRRLPCPARKSIPGWNAPILPASS